jgi:lipopolysaccharide biosynthesis glycosyltransferase
MSGVQDQFSDKQHLGKALVTACDAGYLIGAETLLKTVRKHHPEVKRYCIVPPADVGLAEQRLTGAGLAEVLPLPRRIRGVPDRLQIAVAKLFTPMVREEVAAWIDCDAVMCRPAPEIWQVPEGRVNAVQDTAYEILNMVEPALRDSFSREFPDAIHRRGLNGGFFALRPAEWKNLPEQYELALERGRYEPYPTIFDQPLLSALMLDKVDFLPFAFNAHHLYDYRIPRDARVVHFTNNPKPWMANYPKHEPAYYYWIKYGLEETRSLRLLSAKARIVLRTPQRLLSRSLRNWRHV